MNYARMMTISPALLLLAAACAGENAGNVTENTSAVRSPHNYNYSFRGNGANATSYDVDDAGCVVTSAGVFASSGVTHVVGNGAPTTSTDVTLFIDQYDACTGALLGSAFGYAQNASFSGNLDSATLSGDIEVYDYFRDNPDGTIGGSRLVPVSITWTGEGDTISGSSSSRYSYSGGHALYRHRGSNRAATLSGTIDGASAAGEFSYGELFNSRDGSLTIFRN